MEFAKRKKRDRLAIRRPEQIGGASSPWKEPSVRRVQGLNPYTEVPANIRDVGNGAAIGRNGQPTSETASRNEAALFGRLDLKTNDIIFDLWIAARQLPGTRGAEQ